MRETRLERWKRAPVTFKGKYLFANLDAPTGELKVEVLDAEGKTIEPFTLENSIPVSSDETEQRSSTRSNDASY
jgi:hypothetical protein